MSYYKPSFSQTLAMARGRGYSSPRGTSYRGSSSRGNSTWNGSGSRGGYSGGSASGRFSSFSGSMDSRPSFDSRKYSSSSERFPRPHSEEYHKSYRPDYPPRESGGRRSPERKRLRLEAPSSRHDSYGGYGPSRHEPPSSYSDRRSYSGERHATSTPFSRRDEFRRPTGPPSRGAYRGRLSSRGSRGLKLRDRPRRRLVESSYAVRKRVIPRPSEYNRRLKMSRMRSAIARKASKKRSDKEESGDEKSKEKMTKDGEDKSTDEKEDVGEKPIKKEKDATPEKENKSETGEEKAKKKTFIKLNCPHCGVKAVTFRKYDIHLSSKTHMIAMRKIALKQKSILAQMRQAQRNTQNELEKSSDDLTSKTNFCPLCKLNYKQRKAVHQLSEAHKNMKKFLMPYCKVCNITFKSPMIFESHCCSIEHIKRKQRMENCGSDVSAEEDNLENFTTIDSVGDGDGSDEDRKDEAKEPVNVGIEQIRKIESYYCDLCKMHLPRGEETDMPKILSRHCKMRVHMQRYVRYKEDQDLEKRAEKLQRKEMAEKEVKVKKEKDEKENIIEAENNSTKESKETESSKGGDDDEARDDKLWADVDKDLGDILAEAESGNKSSDEDEDDSHVNGERYDRFKLSEKNEEELLTEEDNEKLDKTADLKENEEKK